MPFNHQDWETTTYLILIGWLGLAAGLAAGFGIAAHAAPYQSSLIEMKRIVLSTFLQGGIGIPILMGLGILLNKTIGAGTPSLVIRAFNGELMWSSVLPQLELAIAIGVGLGVLRLLAGPFQNVQGNVRLLWSLYVSCYDELVYRLFGISLLLWIIPLFSPPQISHATGWIAIACIAIFAAINQNPAFGFSNYLVSLAPLTASQRTRSVLQSLLAAALFGWLYLNVGIEAAIVAHLIATVIPSLRRSKGAQFTGEQVFRLQAIVQEMADESSPTAQHAIVAREQAFLRTGIAPFVLDMEADVARRSGADEILTNLDSLKVVFGRYYLQRIFDPTFAPQIDPLQQAEAFSRIRTREVQRRDTP